MFSRFLEPGSPTPSPPLEGLGHDCLEDSTSLWARWLVRFLTVEFRCILCLSCSQYCGAKEQLTLDHVVPSCLGGGNSWENLVTCCARCNSRKGSKTLAELKWKLRSKPRVSVGGAGIA